MKKSRKWTQTLSLVLGAALLFAVPGCGKKEVTGRDLADETDVATAVTEITNLYTAEKGEEVSSKDITATLDHAYLSPYTFVDGDEKIGITFFQMTIHNGSDQKLIANSLSQSFGAAAAERVKQEFEESGVLDAVFHTLEQLTERRHEQ